MTEKTISKPSHDHRFYELLERLAERLHSLRYQKDESMEKVATSIGVTRGTIFKTERPQPEEDLSLATVWALAHHYGMTIDQMFVGLDALTDEDELNIQDFKSRPLQLDKLDELSFGLVPEIRSLQVRADLAEEACLGANNEKQMEALSKHSARLRHKRYQLILKQREENARAGATRAH